MQGELQSFPRLNYMTSFPHFYYVVLTLFASDEIKEQHFPDVVFYYFSTFLVIENRTFGKHMKNLH